MTCHVAPAYESIAMATLKEKIKTAIEDAQAFISMHVSGRVTQHLFDPLTLIGGLAVLVLVLVLLVLSFSSSEPAQQQRQRGAGTNVLALVAMLPPRPGDGTGA